MRRRRVRLAYADARGNTSTRLVDPWGLVVKDEAWYLVAGTENGRRTFRVDRVVAAEVTDEGFGPPASQVLKDAWEETVGLVEERRSRTWATVLVEERHAFVLRDHFGRHCEVGETRADGRVPVRVAAPTPLDLARNLAGWAGALEVLDSPPVQAQLARIGAELVATYDVSRRKTEP